MTSFPQSKNGISGVIGSIAEWDAQSKYDPSIIYTLVNAEQKEIERRIANAFDILFDTVDKSGNI